MLIKKCMRGFLNGQCIENELLNENPVVIHNIQILAAP